MVAIVNQQNRLDHAATVAQMHRDRKTVFVDGLKWDVPVVDGIYEIDEYDTEDAVYLIAADPVTGAHLGSVRLVNTAGPHLLGDKFAYLCAEAVPTGDDIWEVTRLCTTPGLAPGVALQIRMTLTMALMEYGLANGISRYTMMTRMSYLSTVLAVGWNAEPLGMPADVAGDPVGALQIAVDVATLGRLRQMYGFQRPVLDAGATPSALAA